MRKLSFGMLAMGMWVVSAHVAAAPAPPGTAVPRATPTPIPSPLVHQGSFDVEVIPGATPCGVERTRTLKLTNRASVAGSVQIEDRGVVDGGAIWKAITQAQLTAAGTAGATQTVTLAMPQKQPLDCHKALGHESITFTGTTGLSHPEITLHPRAFSMLHAGVMPPAQTVWVRRAEVVGACGTVVTPTLTLHSSSLTSQSATVTLTFGATTKTSTVSVAPNVNVPVTLVLPTALDCEGAPIPAFQYALQGGSPTDNGAVSITDVTFAL